MAHPPPAPRPDYFYNVNDDPSSKTEEKKEGDVTSTEEAETEMLPPNESPVKGLKFSPSSSTFNNNQIGIGPQMDHIQRGSTSLIRGSAMAQRTAKLRDALFGTVGGGEKPGLDVILERRRSSQEGE